MSEFREEWKQKLEQAEVIWWSGGRLETLRAMWKQDPEGQLERAGRLIDKMEKGIQKTGRHNMAFRTAKEYLEKRGFGDRIKES